MQKVILKRLLQLIPTLLVVITFTFAATRLIPGDPVAAMLGEQYDATKVDALRESWGSTTPSRSSSDTISWISSTATSETPIISTPAP